MPWLHGLASSAAVFSIKDSLEILDARQMESCISHCVSPLVNTLAEK